MYEYTLNFTNLKGQFFDHLKHSHFSHAKNERHENEMSGYNCVKSATKYSIIVQTTCQTFFFFWGPLGSEMQNSLKFRTKR